MTRHPPPGSTSRSSEAPAEVLPPSVIAALEAALSPDPAPPPDSKHPDDPQLDTTSSERGPAFESNEPASGRSSLPDVPTALLRALTDAVPHPLMIKDPEGRYLYVNAAACRVIGRPKREIVGATDEALFGSSVGAALRRHEWNAICGGLRGEEDSKAEEFQAEEFQAEEFQASGPGFQVSPFETFSSEASSSEAPLSEAPLFQRGAPEASAAHPETTGRLGSLPHVNCTDASSSDSPSLGEPAPGLSAADPSATGSSATSRHTTDTSTAEATAEASYVTAVYLETMPAPSGAATSHTGHATPSPSRTFRTRRVPLCGPDGELVGTLGVCEDVTAEYRQQQCYRRSARTHRAMIDQARDSIYVVAKDGTLLDVNDSMARVMGYDRSHLLGRPLADLLCAERTDLSAVNTALNQARQGTAVRTEVWARRADGTVFPKDVQLQPIDYFGTPAVLGVGRDITDWKDGEAALQEAKEHAEEAARLKSALLANMSHEVRTPLTSIIGFAELIAEQVSAETAGEGETAGQDETEDQEKMAHFADLILKSSRRLLTTLDAVLKLSKLEAEAWTPVLEPVCLSSVATEVEVLMQPKARSAGVALRVNVPRQQVGALAASDALRQVVTSVVDNAIKFTPEGGQVTLEVCPGSSGARDTKDTEACPRMIVRDTGVGMSADFLPKATEAFQQEETGTQRSYQGTGLGLAIARQLIDAMGGTLRIDSTKGKGTSVCVALSPQDRAGSEAQADSQEHPNSQEQTDPQE